MKLIYGNKVIQIDFDWTSKIIVLIANVAIIASVVYAIIQYEANKDHSKISFTLETINKFYNKEFYQSTALITSKEADTATVEYIDASNLVFNSYYLISILYFENIGDNEIITRAIKNDLKIYIESKSFKWQMNQQVKDEIIKMNKIMNLKY